MTIYQSNEFEYYNDILSNSDTLNNILFEYQLYDDNDKITTFINSLVNKIMEPENNSFIFSGSLAKEIYNKEKELYEVNNLYRDSSMLKAIIEDSIYDCFDISLDNEAYFWEANESLYVEILKSILYGYTTNFFFVNRERFLPEYDWYLINQEDKRKHFMEAIFKEYDKFSYVIDSMKNFVDIDEIPSNMISYLSNILGISMNEYIDFINDKKIRTLIKNIIEIYSYKGSLYSLELFFACLGISLNVNELYFDRRLYYYFDSIMYNTNEETTSNDTNDYKYYLTKNDPSFTVYSFTREKTQRNEFTSSLSESLWNKNKKLLEGITGINIPKELLGFENNSSLDTQKFTFFKTNSISIEFVKFGYADETVEEKEERLFTQTELIVFQSIIEKFMPVFIRKYFPYVQLLGTSFTDSINIDRFLKDSNEIYNRTGSITKNISEINQIKFLKTEDFIFDAIDTFGDVEIKQSSDDLDLVFFQTKYGDEVFTPEFSDIDNYLLETYIMVDTGINCYTEGDDFIIDYYDINNNIESIEFVSDINSSIELELS